MHFLNKCIVRILVVVFALLCITSTSARSELVVTETEYLKSPQISVLIFHNIYPVGKQGGIEIIQHDKRVATNGNIHLIRKKTAPAEKILSQPIPRIDNPERIVDRASNQIKVPFSYTDIDVRCHLLINSLGDNDFEILLNFEDTVDVSLIEELSFQMEFYPEYYKGKSYITENKSGVFPHILTSDIVKKDGEMVLTTMAAGKRMNLAVESPEFGMSIESKGNPVELIDQRQGALREWFAIKVKADLSKRQKAIHLIFKPGTIDGWMRPPVIAHSQVGYHPAQTKRAILELDSRTEKFDQAKLIQLTEQGEKIVLSKVPEKWGNYYRYLYGIFDFSLVQKEGVYQIEYGNGKTTPFRIARDVYQQGVWQPSLLVFLPVQMCHVSVKDRERLWHGLCHKDDGLQAPAPLPFYDGYRQSDQTETRFAPNTTIPGMNQGGWHDAGDDDVNTGSSGRTTYHLALTYEEFKPLIDQTTVDMENNRVHLHQPDGVPDMIQQIKHGVDFLLAQYRVSDHSFVGVISKDWETYLQEGQWGHMTDNFFHNPELPPDSCDGKYSGRFDDRYIFTNKDSRREYAVITYLAAASRSLKNDFEDISTACVNTAKRIWMFEENHEPVFYPSVGTLRNLVVQRTNAAVELYLTTGDKSYLNAIVQNKDAMFKNISGTAWTVSRVIEKIDDPAFKAEFEKHLVSYQDSLQKKLTANPFGVFYEPQVWGFGWDILWGIYTHYYLAKHYPDIFSLQPLEDAVHYSLGAHAASSLSLVSGVGAHKPIPAFGMNRSDYSYTPGGLYSGVNLIRPDFPELKSDHPYLWQQSEYIVFGATPFIFAVLAVDHFLNQTE